MDLPFVSKKKLTKERLIWLVVSIILFLTSVGLAVWLIFLYFAAPKFTEFPTATSQEKVVIKGIARSNAGVVLFDKDRRAVALANADEQGNFVFENILLASGENKFTARAFNAFKKASKSSREIVIKYDTAAPSLELQSAAGLTVNSQNYTVTGKAEPGSVVTVNGVVATVNPDGTWSATVPLNPGENSLTVTATDSAGNQASTTQTVTYTPTFGTEVNTNANENVNTTANTNTETATNANENTNTAPNTNTAANINTNTNTAPPSPSPPPVTISVTAQVSNPTPNVRSNETIIATVKDNNGNPVTNAVVRAVAHYKSGNITYNLVHSGGGTYTVSFKVGTSAEVGYKVLVDISASFSGMTASTQVSFTPRQ